VQSNNLRIETGFFIILETAKGAPLAMAVARKQKMFVLDTNVILHDSKCMYQFEEHDIVIPITVLEELDGFKKGNESLNFHAREFVRAVDGLAQQPLFSKGVQIGKDWATSSSRWAASTTRICARPSRRARRITRS
jgi:predicted ribonuclease YlaK